MAVRDKYDNDARVLLASAARTVTHAGETSRRLPGLAACRALVFTLDVTAAATDAADTLDVYIQTKLDADNWTDVVHFTQCLGNGGALRYVAKVIADVATAEFENGTGLGAAAVRNLIGDNWRVRYDITDADGDGSFTFSVTACPM